MNQGMMSYVRSKMINACGPYWYEVESKRKGKTVHQVYLRYIGKTREKPPRARPKTVVPKEERGTKSYLEVGEGTTGERKELKTWDRTRYNRARMISESTGCSYIQADGLAKTAWRMGLDPSGVDWDALQGKDLSYDERVEKLSDLYGISARTEREYEIEHQNWIEEQADRQAYREETIGTVK